MPRIARCLLFPIYPRVPSSWYLLRMHAHSGIVELGEPAPALSSFCPSTLGSRRGEMAGKPPIHDWRAAAPSCLQTWKASGARDDALMMEGAILVDSPTED